MLALLAAWARLATTCHVHRWDCHAQTSACGSAQERSDGSACPCQTSRTV
ncbi:MAG: hypothetical protein ABSA01_03165 [Anaerolineales bacterium]